MAEFASETTKSSDPPSTDLRGARAPSLDDCPCSFASSFASFASLAPCALWWTSAKRKVSKDWVQKTILMIMPMPFSWFAFRADKGHMMAHVVTCNVVSAQALQWEIGSDAHGWDFPAETWQKMQHEGSTAMLHVYVQDCASIYLYIYIYSIHQYINICIMWLMWFNRLNA